MQKRGFTLIEIILTILILGIITTLIFSSYIRIQSQINTNKWRNELTEEGVKMCNLIWRELVSAQEILFADMDTILYIDQEGGYSSLCWRDSLLFKTGKNLSPKKAKIPCFRFEYFLPPEFVGEGSEPITFLPLDELECDILRVIDYEMEIQRGKTIIHLRTGAHLRGLR